VANEILHTVVLIAGLSGAGCSSAQKVLADLGFYAVDNLPLNLLPDFFKHITSVPDKYRKVSLHVDISTVEDRDLFLGTLKNLAPNKTHLELLFLDCDTATIIKRYNETRRPHPGFNSVRDKTLEDTIAREKNRFLPIKEKANFCIDTTNTNVHELKHKIKNFVDSLALGSAPQPRVNFTTFGYKYGLPLNCDLVFDVRFIKNPYFELSLRELTGLNQDVKNYVLNQLGSNEFIVKTKELLNFLIPLYIEEGKAYINIGIGCTGGKHRSVVIAEELSRLIQSDKFLMSVEHRDINKI
jgi:UPF0042 nucleotide-binding protein